MSDLMNEAKTILRWNNLHPKHALGQNFLVNEAVLDTIITAADLKLSDTVVEIGPGLGFLTRRLAVFVNELHAYEIDEQFVKILKKEFHDNDKVQIHHKSALEYRPPSGKYKIVANIPYYLTSPFLKRHLEEVNNKPTSLILMVQKEVADEIIIKDGRYSLLSVAVHTFADPTLVAYVPSQDFYPAPKVDSAIIKISVRKKQYEAQYLKTYFKIVKIGFSKRRKQIKNNVIALFDTEGDMLKLLKQAEIDPMRRAETFAIREWHTLTRLYQKYDKNR